MFDILPCVCIYLFFSLKLMLRNFVLFPLKTFCIKIKVMMRMWSNRNSHSLLVGIQNGTVTLEDSWVVSCKTKHSLTI